MVPVSTLPPAPSERGSGSPDAHAWGIGRVLTVMTVLALVGFWIWILAGGPERANPDRVDDRVVVAKVDGLCKSAERAIDKLPAAHDSSSPIARAAVVDQASGIVQQMVDGIEADAPRAGADGVRFRGWIRDWRTYIRDRRDYARRLRGNPRSQFLLDTNKAGDSVDRVITNFADINDIPACDAPGDVG